MGLCTAGRLLPRSPDSDEDIDAADENSLGEEEGELDEYEAAEV